MTSTISVTISGYDYKRLMDEHARNEEIINTIKDEVSTADYDNINNPVPLFTQLSA